MSDKKLQVAALTSGYDQPASRFRVRQHIHELKNHNVQVTEYCPAFNQHARLPGKLSSIRMRYLPPVLAAQVMLNMACRIPAIIGTYKADVVWLERSFVPGMEWMVYLSKAPRVLDVDDAIWLSNPLGGLSAKLLTSGIDAVVAGNSYLADWYSAYCSKVYVVPTAIDCRRFSTKQYTPKSGNDLFVIGWTGTSGNFPYFKIIEKSLAHFLKTYPQARFLIVADRRPVFDLIPESQIIFEPWTAQSEVMALHKMDVGIMPLADNHWTRGKCSFKMLQYMAAGIPVVVSNVGMNIEVLKNGLCGFGLGEEGWYECLEQLYRQPDLRLSMGKLGRKIVENHYSVELLSKKLAKVFLDLV